MADPTVVTTDTPDIPKPAGLSHEPNERGASGTMNFGGVIAGEEYNPKLSVPQCWDIYDEMRKSDPQVQASLEICKAPLTSATWKVSPPENATPQELEVAAFCQRALFDRGSMADSWDYTLDHALLQLDFGVTVFEKVWVLGDDGKIRLNRLAPRLPKTIQKWNPSPNGHPASIVQYVIKDGAYQQITIDAQDLAWSARKQEGDNYWGVSVLRSAYKDWFYKTQAEKADATRIYRFGVGIPMASRDKEYAYSEGEEAAVTQTLKRMSSHERAYIQTHGGINWSVLIPAGNGGATDITAKIQHHNLMIVRNVLAEFMSGTADGLNSGRTRTLADIFTSCLYSTGNRLAGMFDVMVLRPMCVWNFSMQGLRFPTLECGDVSDVDMKNLADIVARLAALKVVTPDDDLEGFLRKMLGLPPMSDASKGKSRERTLPPTTTPGQPAPGAPSTTPPTDPDNPNVPASEVKARALRDSRPAIALKRSDRIYNLYGRDYCRPPTSFEMRMVSIGEIPDTLTQAGDELTRELRDIRRSQLQDLAETIAKKDARTSTGEFTDLRPDEFTMPQKTDVERAIKCRLTTVANFGATQVRLELERQGAESAGISITTLKVSRPASYALTRFVLSSAGDGKALAKSALTTSAEIAAKSETDRWFNWILEIAMQLRRRGIQGDALVAAIVDQLGTPEQLETGLAALAKGEINEAFAIGRAVEATAQAEQIAEVEYSCLLDVNSCDPCVAEDGKVFAYGSEEYYRTLPPFTDCEGNRGRPGACRCVHLFKLKPADTAQP